MISFRAIGCVIAIVALAGVNGQPWGDSFDEPLAHAMNKLEMYSVGKTTSSGLKKDDLDKAMDQWQSFSGEERSAMVKRLPLVKLFVDFALLPLDNYEAQINVDDVDSIFDRFYVQRLEKNYKKFRPGYLGGRVDDGRYTVAKRVELVLSAFIGAVDVPITKKLVLSAKQQHDAFFDRMEEIVQTDDIYGNISEYTFAMNLINRGDVRALNKVVFQNVDMVEKDLPMLKKKLFAEMERRNFRIRDGHSFWLGPVDKV